MCCGTLGLGAMKSRHECRRQCDAKDAGKGHCKNWLRDTGNIFVKVVQKCAEDYAQKAAEKHFGKN